ncbi:MAG: ATP-binding protein [Gemmatimonadota bacterium]|nr:ATP-binding protein [Gemmatimonadota bacterium]
MPPRPEIGALLDDAPCGYLSFADDGTLLSVNRTLLRALDYTAGELIGRSVETILPIASRIFYQTHFFPLVRLHGHAEEIFLLMRDSNGDDLAFLTNAVRRERDGSCVTECVVMRVIERRKFEESLLRAKNEAEDARTLAETHQRELQVANDLLERQALELELSQDHLQKQAEELALQSDALQSLNNDLLERGAELERLRLIAEDANKAKSSFLAVMSHELRTPLNAIGGYVQLLEMEIQGPITEAQADALARVSRSQRHLLRLINDVLNLARVEAGRLEYTLDTLDVNDLVGAVLPMVEPQLKARNLQFDSSIASGLKAYADRDKTEQVLLNLLSNAVKFTEPGGAVSIVAGANAGYSDRICIQVADTGIGIPPHRLEQMFEPFAQMDTSHTRRAEGTGLGLTISRDLALGMGGDITATSEVGKGSTFTLSLPSSGTAPAQL